MILYQASASNVEFSSLKELWQPMRVAAPKYVTEAYTEVDDWLARVMSLKE